MGEAAGDSWDHDRASEPDGSQDEHSTTFESEDDGSLVFHLENAVKFDFLKNAFTVSQGVEAVSVPTSQAYGV